MLEDALNKQIVFLQKLLKKEENKHCADCHRRYPTWASTTFGAFICIKCAGFHRELGTHITKVKSMDLDKWPNDLVILYSKLSKLYC